MADLALVTANRVEVVGIPQRQTTLAAGSDVTAGAPLAINTSGKFVPADANGADGGKSINTIPEIARVTKGFHGLECLFSMSSFNAFLKFSHTSLPALKALTADIPLRTNLIIPSS